VLSAIQSRRLTSGAVGTFCIGALISRAEKITQKHAAHAAVVPKRAPDGPSGWAARK